MPPNVVGSGDWLACAVEAARPVPKTVAIEPGETAVVKLALFTTAVIAGACPVQIRLASRSRNAAT